MPALSEFLLRVELALKQGDEYAIEALKTEIFEALEKASGNRKEAAANLKIDYSTYLKAVKKLDLQNDINLAYQNPRAPRMITAGHPPQTMSIAAWARKLGINRTTIMSRLRRGAKDAEAVDPEDWRTG